MSAAITAAVVVAAGSAYAANKAGEAAEGSAEASAESQRAQIEFERERYEDWKGTYGPIQDNLAKYYQDLSPDFYEVQGLEAFEKEQARAMDQVRQSLAQRGISDSGVAAATDIAFAQSSAAERATIRAQAPTIAANEQLRFLQVGMGQDPSQSMANTLAMQAQQDQQRAYRDEAAAGQAMQSAVSTVGTALSDYARASQNTGTTQPITRDPRY